MGVGDGLTRYAAQEMGERLAGWVGLLHELPGIPRGLDQPACGWKVLKPGCPGRQGVIIYPLKAFFSCFFFINNFLCTQRCPEPQPSSHWPLLFPLWAASKAGPFFESKGTKQLAPASSLCSVNQKDTGSATCACWPGPKNGRHLPCKSVS